MKNITFTRVLFAIQAGLSGGLAGIYLIKDYDFVLSAIWTVICLIDLTCLIADLMQNP